jgi:hypothetical protein
MPVGLVEGLLEHLAGLAVDAADGIFQRVEGFAQVRRLRVEERLALGRDAQLLERRHVDRTEVGHRLMQPLDLRLQRARPDLVRLERLRESALVGTGLRELLGELLDPQPGRLLLQPQLANPVAEWRELLLNRQSLFVGAPQGRPDFLQPTAGRRQLLLPVDAVGEAGLKRLAQPLVLQRGEFTLRGRVVRRGAGQLLR